MNVAGNKLKGKASKALWNNSEGRVYFSLKDGGMHKVSRQEYQDSLCKLQNSAYEHPLLTTKEKK